MKVNNKKYILISIVVILFVGIFFIWHKDNNVALDEVSLRANEVDKKQLAMFIRNSEEEKYQEYTNGNTFPEGYKLNIAESGCSDSDGNKVNDEGIISVSSDNKVIIKSKQTVYCYLYFDKNSLAGDILKEKVNQGGLIQTNDDTDLEYRYIGTCNVTSGSNKNGCDGVVDNFICFGTTNVDECKTTTSNYLYRIIGVDTNSRLKLIKNTSIGSFAWHWDSRMEAIWDSDNSDSGKIEAELHQKLNGTTFLSSPTYVPNGWSNKISYTNWYIGDSNGETGSGKTDTGDNVWKWESSSSASTASKIGLMYFSDYYYSLNGSENCYNRDTSKNSQCKTSWLHISNNGDSNVTYSDEWTMSIGGWFGDGYYYTYYVHSTGWIDFYNMTNLRAVRPVFYLDSNVKITGEGTLSNPYMIS